MDDLIVTTTIHNNSVERKPNPDPQDFFVDYVTKYNIINCEAPPRVGVRR